MDRLTKNALLEATDLHEKEVELPELGGSVLVRSLPAAYSNQASSEALVLKTIGRDQIATVDTAKLEILQALHGLVEPHLDTYEEAEKFAQQSGIGFKKVIAAIDEISGVDKKAIAEAEARFPASRRGSDGDDVGATDSDGVGDRGSGGPARTGAGTPHVGKATG